MEDRPKGWLAQIAGAIDLPEDPGLREVEGVKVRFLGAGEAETAAVRTLLPAELLESPDRFAGEADRAASDSVLRRLRAPAPAAGPDPAGRTVTAVKSFSVCPRRFRLSRLFPLPDRPEPGRGEGVPLGTDFHRMMEREWRGLPPAERNEELIGWRENLLAHPEMEPFLRAGWREGEVSFTAPVSGRELRGKIDLLARTGEDRRILDYKTDRAGAEELLDRYRVSLNLYRLGIERVVGGEGGVEAWIYGAREGVFIEVPEGEEEALASLEEYDRAEEEGVWPPRKNRECGSCLYRRDCPHPSFSAPDEKK